MLNFREVVCALSITITACIFPSSARLDEDFRHKEVRLVIGQEGGTTYDIYARTVTRHMTRWMPGKPTFVAINMPGAGSVVALNHLYNVASKDGSVIGAINPGAIANGILRPETAHFDARKFNWIGSVARETEVIVVRSDSKVRSLSDSLNIEIVMGGTGGASSVLPAMLNGVLGTKFKIISGYKGANDAFLAMMRGEVDGVGATTLTNLKTTQANLLEGNKVRIIGQYGLAPNATLAGVPTVMDLVQDQNQRDAFRLILTRQEIGRAMLAPPDVPQRIASVFREAFEKTMNDPAFREEVKVRQMDYDPQSAETLQRLVADLYTASPEVVERVRGILGGRN